MRAINRHGLTGLSSSAPKTPRTAGPLSCSQPSRSTDADTRAWQLLQSKLVQVDKPHQLNSGLPAEDAVHRDLGLWAIDSVNANVWSTLRAYVAISAADAFVAQEAKVTAGDAVRSAEDSLATIRWRASVQPCGFGPAGGPSAGTAVGVRQHIGLGLPSFGHAFNGSPRFQLRKMGAICKGGLHIGSAYLQDVVGPTDPANLAILDEIAGCLNVLRGPWVIGGDFNMSPEELASTGFLTLVGGVIHAPEDSTCGVKSFDFFIVSQCLSPAVYAVHAVSGAGFAPHVPVRLLLRAAPRCMKVRCLAKPRGFSARLPFGPASQQAHLSAHQASRIASAGSTASLSIHTEFPKLVELMEQQLSDVCSHDAKLAAAHAGRVRGPKLTWKPAIQLGGELARTSPATKARTRTMGWLRSLSTLSPASAGAQRVRVAVCRHEHSGDASELQFSLFRQWQCGLSPSVLAIPSIVSSLLSTAVVMVDRLSSASLHSSRADWLSWLNEGPGRGLSRQHRMSRVALGWVPSTAGPAGQADGDEAQDFDPDIADAVDVATRLEHNSSQSIIISSSEQPTCPMSLQQSVDDTALGWAQQWSADSPLPPCEWPADMGPLPPMLELAAFKDSLVSFPTYLGLGWDDIHPRALLRLDDQILLALLRILFLCECAGEWPSFTSLVIIALLPKSDGGLRPIGLFPWLPKVWAKARRSVALAWECQVTRPYLYAGPGRGADHAAWKQAARAEHASTIRGAAYGMSLIDLVKAFDRVPWHVLIREARKLGYSLWILRLSIAAYKADRVIRVCGIYSQFITPQRSLTAGSAFATTELRLVLIHIVDSALMVAPLANPTLYVDDLSVEAVGGDRLVVTQVAAFTLTFCRKVEADHMTVSRTKSTCTASTPTLGARLANALKEFGIKYQGRVTSLGGALGAGRRRNATVINKRLKAFKARGPRFRKLAVAGVCTKRLMRTGGGAALTYGQAITGVAPATLLAQRRAAAAACAPAGGQCGQDLDLALILADGSATGRADPAFDAHLLPIGQWADAVWHRWLPLTAPQQTVDVKLCVLPAVKSLWHHVRGPAAAMVASAWRLNWTVESATSLITDEGCPLDLLKDPPVVVRSAVCEAVRRWRNLLIFAKFPHLGPPDQSHGLHLRPLWAALRHKNASTWTSAHQASLKAAFADRQWPQDRGWAAGWAQHDRCILCVESAATARVIRQRSEASQQTPTVHDRAACPPEPGTGSSGSASHPAAAVAPAAAASPRASAEGLADEPCSEPTHEDICNAPVGTLIHRVCQCPHFQSQRAECGLRALVEAAGDLSRLPHELQCAFSSGLFPVPRLPLQPSERPPAHGSFEWVRWCDSEDLNRSFTGTVYTDGSRIHDGHPDTRRLGWSFVVINEAGHVIAAARGSPPYFITDIPGTEAWAILQASAFALPGCRLFSDCKPCVDALHAGRAWACSAKRPLARVFLLLFDSFERSGLDPSDVTWMPAHTYVSDVGIKLRGDGVPITALHRLGNSLADNQAKLAAGQHAVSQQIVDLLGDFSSQALTALQWLGRVSWLATHHGKLLARDSEASRLRAGVVKRSRVAQRQPAPSWGGRPPTPSVKPPRAATQRAARWCLRAANGGSHADGSRPDLGRHCSHRLMRSCDTFWCLRCGAYASLRGAGLAAPCTGPAPRSAAGGRAQQLRFLKRGLHPKTRQRMAPSMPWWLGNSSAQAPAQNPRVRGDELELSKSRFGRLRLRVRRKEALRLAASIPDDEPAPETADDRVATSVTPVTAFAPVPAAASASLTATTPAPRPVSTLAPTVLTRCGSPSRVRRTAHRALSRSTTAPFAPLSRGASSSHVGDPGGRRRRLRGKQAHRPFSFSALAGVRPFKRPAAPLSSPSLGPALKRRRRPTEAAVTHPGHSSAFVSSQPVRVLRRPSAAVARPPLLTATRGRTLKRPAASAPAGVPRSLGRPASAVAPPGTSKRPRFCVGGSDSSPSD